jgi:MFS family permease
MAPGCLIGGFIMQKYGRKCAHYFLCIPTVLGWLAILLADGVPLLLVGRFLTGKHKTMSIKGESKKAFHSSALLSFINYSF